MRHEAFSPTFCTFTRDIAHTHTIREQSLFSSDLKQVLLFYPPIFSSILSINTSIAINYTMPSDATSSQPLLSRSSSSSPSPKPHHNNHNHEHHLRPLKSAYTFCRASVKAFLSSPAQHYTVLGLVSFDLLGIFADIIINLYQCDEGDFAGPVWADVREGLSIAGLVFSCLFMVELICSVWAFGWRLVLIHNLLIRFLSLFHTFDFYLPIEFLSRYILHFSY